MSTVDASVKIWFRGLTRTFYKPFALEVRMDTLRSPSMESTPQNKTDIPPPQNKDVPRLRTRLADELVLRYAMDPPDAAKVCESGVFDDMSFHEAFARLRRMREFLICERTGDLLLKEPRNIRRKLERFADCVEAIKYCVGVDAAKDVIARHMAILDLSAEDLAWKMAYLERMVPNEMVRSAFVKMHPSFFMLPQTELGLKDDPPQPQTVDTFWDYIRFDATGRIIPLLTLVPDIKDGFTPLVEQPTPNRLGRPGFSFFPKEKKERKPRRKREKREPSETPSVPGSATASTPDEIILPIDEADLDVDCRILPECTRTPKKMEVDENEREDVARLVSVFTNPKRIGMQRDFAFNYVLYRPWLHDRSTEDLKRLIDTLWELGVRDDKLFDVTNKYASLLHLGYEKLIYVLEFLKRNRQCKPPDDLRDLSIPYNVWRSRLKRLNDNALLLSDPRFSKALFARTEREFRNVLSGT